MAVFALFLADGVNVKRVRRELHHASLDAAPITVAHGRSC
jgi:hypothetical protein